MEASIELYPVVLEKREKLWQLFKDYIEGFVVLSEGKFKPDYVALKEQVLSYWKEANRFAYFIKNAGNEIAGFVLVNDYCKIDLPGPKFSVAEFYVVPDLRRKGIGVEAAKKVFKQHPGNWEVRVLEYNTEGYGFWSNVLADFQPEIRQLNTTGFGGTAFLFNNGQ